MILLQRNRISSLICASGIATVLLLTSGADACGVLTHNEVLRRSRYLFSLTDTDSASPFDPDPFYHYHPAMSQILSSPANTDAEQAGAFFPDWGYGCFSNDDPAEAAHWPPFISAAIKHFHAKYGPMFSTDAPTNAQDGTNETRIPRNSIWPNGTAMTAADQQHKERLLSFIFAAAAHGSADATWHSLKMSNGFIRMVAGLDFEGSYSDAHTLVDTGGDVILSKRIAGLPPHARDWVSTNWWIPIEDILEIYKEMRIPINVFSFRFCVARGLAAMRAVVGAGGRLYDQYANQSPAMIDYLDEYYLGGLDEMAANAAWCWRNLTTWVANGVEAGSQGWDICDTFKLINSRHGGRVEPPSAEGDGVSKTSGENSTDSGNIHAGHRLLESLLQTNETFKKLFKVYEANIYETEVGNLGAVEVHIPSDFALFHRDDTLSPSYQNSSEPISTDEVIPPSFPGTFADPVYLQTRIPFSKFGSYLSLVNHGSNAPIPLELIVSAPLESEGQDYLSGGAAYFMDLKKMVSSPSAEDYEAKTSPDLYHRISPTSKSPEACHILVSTSTDVSNLPITSSSKFSSSSRPMLEEYTYTTRISFSSASSGPQHPNTRFGLTSTPLRLSSGIYNVVTTPGSQIYNDTSPRIGFIPSGKIDIYHGPIHLLSITFEDLPGGSIIGEREFGSAILAADIDGDGEEELIIGSAYADGWRWGCGVQAAEGEVVVVRLAGVLAAIKEKGCTVKNNAEEEGKEEMKILRDGGWIERIRLPGEEKRGKGCDGGGFEWFGRQLVWLAGSRLLGVSAPGVGKVFLYGYWMGRLELVDWLEGNKGSGFGAFGIAAGVSTGVFKTQWVAVGVPNDENQVGFVDLFKIREAGNGRRVVRIVSKEAERFGKFGMVLTPGKANGDGGLWIGSSWAGEERGAVWWIDVDAVLDTNFFGAKDEKKLAGEGGGQVVLGGVVDGKDGEDPIESVAVGVQIWGPEAKAHFGASILVADIDGSGKEDLIVGLPYAGVSHPDENRRFMGSVAVYLRTDAALSAEGGIDDY